MKDVERALDNSFNDRNKKPLLTDALEAERFEMYYKAAAAISTAALVDYGFVIPDDYSNVIDHHKVRRLQQQLRQRMKEEPLQSDDKVSALFFDGRKDMTLV